MRERIWMVISWHYLVNKGHWRTINGELMSGYRIFFSLVYRIVVLIIYSGFQGSFLYFSSPPKLTNHNPYKLEVASAPYVLFWLLIWVKDLLEQLGVVVSVVQPISEPLIKVACDYDQLLAKSTPCRKAKYRQKIEIC